MNNTQIAERQGTAMYYVWLIRRDLLLSCQCVTPPPADLTKLLAQSHMVICHPIKMVMMIATMMTQDDEDRELPVK